MKKIIKTIKNNKEKGEDFPGSEAGPPRLGSPMDRRSFIAGSTLVAGGMLAYPLMVSSAGETTPTQSGSARNETTLPDFSFPLAQQPARVLPGGSAREATAVQFPVSKNIAGVLMTLKPGGLRELHWHANAAEWAYVIEGAVRVTIVDPQGRIEIADFAPGDVW